MPNGTYVVGVVSGDASYFDSVFRTTVEGVLTVKYADDFDPMIEGTRRRP